MMERREGRMEQGGNREQRQRRLDRRPRG
jgi:hypothetical protein